MSFIIIHTNTFSIGIYAAVQQTTNPPHSFQPTIFPNHPQSLKMQVSTFLTIASMLATGVFADYTCHVSL